LWDGRRLDVVQEWSVPKEEVSTSLTPGPIVVDQTGILYLGVTNQIVILTGQGRQIATLDLPQTATSLTLGQDGYLYVTSSNSLFRIKLRSQALKIPTNMAVTKVK
jgi:sugar lactone lactonase YvrE